MAATGPPSCTSTLPFLILTGWGLASQAPKTMQGLKGCVQLGVGSRLGPAVLGQKLQKAQDWGRAKDEQS